MTGVFNVIIKNSDSQLLYTICVYIVQWVILCMIPLPPSVNPIECLSFYKAVVDNLKIRSSHHESWHTHKRDTSVCWICDLLEISTIMISEMERFISKSALDIDDQIHVSEGISEDEGESINAPEDYSDGGTSYNIPGDI